jgi:phage terminase small subunit
MPYSAELTISPTQIPEGLLPDSHPILCHGLKAPDYLPPEDAARFRCAVESMTPAQSRFVAILYAMEPRNFTKAAIAAGYSAKNAAKVGKAVLKTTHGALAWDYLTSYRLPNSHPAAPRRQQMTRDELADILAEMVRATPEDYARTMSDLAQGRSTVATSSPIYGATITARGVELKTVDKLQAAKTLAALRGWSLDKAAAEGIQAQLSEVLASISGQGRSRRKPPETGEQMAETSIQTPPES